MVAYIYVPAAAHLIVRQIGVRAMEKIKVQCCFCAETIKATAEELVECAVGFKDGSSQKLWCHVDCLGTRLHPSVPWLPLSKALGGNGRTPASYDETAFSRDVISRWGQINDALIDDEGLLHVQMAHLGMVCKASAKAASEIFEFLEGLLSRKDAISEIENALGISFLEWPEIKELGFENQLPAKLRQTIKTQWERYQRGT
jgi:hypothetical protein